MLRAMIADLSAPQLPARWQRAAQVLMDIGHIAGVGVLHL